MFAAMIPYIRAEEQTDRVQAARLAWSKDTDVSRYLRRLRPRSAAPKRWPSAAALAAAGVPPLPAGVRRAE